MLATMEKMVLYENEPNSSHKYNKFSGSSIELQWSAYVIYYL
jgi:hypothetical protein